MAPPSEDPKARYDRTIIRGLLNATGDVYARLDIDVFIQTQTDTFNLFLLALDDLKREGADWTDPMSYFQIAGIHGLPKTLWEGVSSKILFEGKTFDNKSSDKNGAGYCAHSVIQFPTWHRPYLAMMEQTIYQRMAVWANKWTGSRGRDYQTALKSFRLPYWDYYRPRNHYAVMSGRTLPNGKTASQYDYSMPQIFTLTKVMVQMPGQVKLTDMDNPLKSFNFPNGSIRDTEWELATLSQNLSADIKKRTVRYGLSRDQIGDMNQALNRAREDNLRMSLNLIEQGAYDNYETFASKADVRAVILKGTDPTASRSEANTIFQMQSGSIEALHGTYHVTVGGFDKEKGGRSGHMSSVPVAAFDPVFWMHHCWFASQTESEGPLLPFRRAQDKTGKLYWDSDRSRYTKTFGYTYPDLDSIETDNVAVMDRFQDKYGWDRRLTPFQRIQGPAYDMQPLPLQNCQVFNYPSGSQWAAEFKPVLKQNSTEAQTFERLMSIKQENAPLFEEAPLSEEAALEEAAPTKEEVPLKKEVPPIAPPKSDAPAPIIIGSGDIDEATVSREWYVDEVVETMTKNGSFSVFYFIGEIGANQPSEWLKLPSFAGLNHNFTAPLEACDNCGVAAEQSRLVTDTAPITSTLLDCVEMRELESMRPEHVRPFLIKNLKWRAVTTNGEIVDPRTLGSFEVSVSCKVAPLPGQQGDVTYEVYPDITAAIIGSASESMDSI